MELAARLHEQCLEGGRAQDVGTYLERYANQLLVRFAKRDPVVLVLSKNLHLYHGEESADIFFSTPFDIAAAQLIAAREHGYDSWDDVASLKSIQIDHSFELALDAICQGDLKSLEAQLVKDPSLVTRRSRFGHRASLLHYLAANGVETHRQVTPPNAVEVMQLLLKHGAEPDAIANTYHGGESQTPLCLLITSSHPHDQGLTPELVRTLVAGGAKVEGVNDDGLPLRVATLFGTPVAVETIVDCGAQVRDLFVAAALGSVSRVTSILKNSYWSSIEKLIGDYRLHQLSDGRSEGDIFVIMRTAIGLAKQHGRDAVVKFIEKLRSTYTDCLDDFDESWSKGNTPELIRSIPPMLHGAIAQRLLCDLINIDMDYRWQVHTVEVKVDSSNDRAKDDSSINHGDDSSMQVEIGSRPALEDYQQAFGEFRAINPLPLFLIGEEFRIRYESGCRPTIDEYLERFPEHIQMLPRLLESVLEEESELYPTLAVSVYHKQTKVLSAPFASRLRIGRQRPKEPEPYVLIDEEDGQRLIIASLQERFLSRVHLEIEPVSNGRVLATNLSAKNSISMPLQLETLAPGESREIQPPVAFVVQTKTVRVSASDA